jgi:hypothetical protein
MEKIIKFLPLTAMILMGMLGCCRKSEPTAWVATKNIVVYKDYVGDAQIVAFNLEVGDICVPGREEIAKVFLYTEVLCPDKGYGWVADHEFKIINKTTLNAELH